MTEQPRKQRKQTAEAPLHERHSEVRATLADDLREQYGQRSVQVNEGDTVEVLRGDFAGEEESVVGVDLKDATVEVENVALETADGEEVLRSLDASNLRVTALDLADEKRQARLESEEKSA